MDRTSGTPRTCRHTRDRRSRDTLRPRRNDSAAIVSPQGIRAGSCPWRCTISCAFAVGARGPSDRPAPASVSALTLRCRYCVGHGHRCRGSSGCSSARTLLEDSGRTYLWQHACSSSMSCTMNGMPSDAEDRLVADLLNVEDVGHRHEAIPHGAHLLGSLEAELAARLHSRCSTAPFGRRLHFLGEASWRWRCENCRPATRSPAAASIGGLALARRPARRQGGIAPTRPATSWRRSIMGNLLQFPSLECPVAFGRLGLCPWI
jgi:hypothetical protein